MLILSIATAVPDVHLIAHSVPLPWFHAVMGLPYASEARVSTDQCVSCGICVGACPTATPFRRRSNFSPGIDLPDRTAATLRQQLHQGADVLKSPPQVVVFKCDNAPTLAMENNCISVNVRCMGALPPPFIDYALTRIKAQGVFLLGCSGGDCKHRLGTQWCESRLAGERDPMLRQRVSRQRIALSWSDDGTPEEHYQKFATTLDQLSLVEQSESESISHPVTVL